MMAKLVVIKIKYIKDMAKSFNPSIRNAFNRAFTILMNNPELLASGKEVAREALLDDPQFARQWGQLYSKFNDDEFARNRFMQLSDSVMAQVAKSNNIDYVPDEDELGPASSGEMMY